MTSRNIVSPQLKNGYTVRHYYHEQSNAWNTDIDKQHASNYYIVDNPQHESRTRRRRRPGLLWTTFPCCESIPVIPLLCILCCLITAITLAVLLPILLISRATTSTTTTGTIVINNNSTILSTSASISITTTTTTTTITTTTNICNGGYTYVIELLYLNINVSFPWTLYTFNYTAPNANAATLAFSFRNDPNYWFLGDVSVTNSTGQQLLSNGDFGAGILANWLYCNPYNANYSGLIITSSSFTSGYCYADGSVGTQDYLSQTFSVQPNQGYTVSFWLTAYGNYSMFAWITMSA